MGKDEQKNNKKIGFLEKIVNVDGVFDAPTLVIANLRRQIVWLIFVGLVGLMIGFIFSNFIKIHIINLGVTIGTVTITLFAIAGTSISMFVTIANQTTLHVPAFLLAKESHLDELVPRFILGIMSSVLLLTLGKVNICLFSFFFASTLFSIFGFCWDTWRLLDRIIFHDFRAIIWPKLWNYIKKNPKACIENKWLNYVYEYWQTLISKPELHETYFDKAVEAVCDIAKKDNEWGKIILSLLSKRNTGYSKIHTD